MHRLRHPIRSITEPYGKAGLTVAILALVLATTGAAFAAVGLNSKQKKEVTKIAKKFAGKNGTNGTNGAEGKQGPEGKQGTPGTNGNNGEPGKNVKVVGNASNSECSAGGKLYEVEGSGVKNKVCNGSPWTAGGTLPKGSTETGAWVTAPINHGLQAAISFTVPLAAPLAFHSKEEEENAQGVSQVHYINPAGKEVNDQFEEVENPVACPGSAASPEAEPGNLCVYAEGIEGNFGGNNELIKNPATNNGGFPAAGAATTGAIVRAFGEEGLAYGTWAVTAP